MSKFCCNTYLIRFMMKEAENLMKGSVHEEDFFIVHDALVLMTAKETTGCMKEKNYYHRWLLPMNGLQDGKPYAGLTVGNIPEFMPLDNSINRDILHCLRFHCVLSRFVLDVDLALKALEIVYLANGASVEGLTDRNGHRQKVVGEGKSVS